jgi:hypothetical protein
MSILCDAQGLPLSTSNNQVNTSDVDLNEMLNDIPDYEAPANEQVKEEMKPDEFVSEPTKEELGMAATFAAKFGSMAAKHIGTRLMQIAGVGFIMFAFAWGMAYTGLGLLPLAGIIFGVGIVVWGIAKFLDKISE